MAAAASPYRGERAWRAVHSAADAHLERTRLAALKALNRAVSRVDGDGLVRALETNAQAEAMRVLLPALAAGESSMRLAMASVLFDCLCAGAEAGLDRHGALVTLAAQSVSRHVSPHTLVGRKPSKPKTPRPPKPPAGDAEVASMAFDKTNPEATSWAAARSSALVVEVGDETRLALRSIIERAFAAGLPPRKAAQLIRAQVGLTSRMAGWVDNRIARLLASGMAQERAAAAGKKYAESLRRRRALNIARTETINASSEGQRQLWLQARDQKLLKPTTKREWITTPSDRTCPRCVKMDGKLAPLDAPFETPEGRRVMGPTLHPQCRCAVGIAKPKGAATGAPVAPGPDFYTTHQEMLDTWTEGRPGAFERMRNPRTTEGRLLLDTLAALPDFNGTVYRGLTLSRQEFDKLATANTWTARLTSSFSKEREVTYDFIESQAGAEEAVGGRPVRVLLEARIRTGKDISASVSEEWQAQQEVVVSGGTKFDRINLPTPEVTPIGTVYRVTLREK